MSHELPKAYDPSVIEERWAEYWVREKLFDVASPDAAPVLVNAADAAMPASDTQPPVKKFTQLLPPPNVTGRLHMGHMLNQTEMDILTRWHRMSGEVSLWVPGTDHAGIATQMMVERQLAGEGKTRQELGRSAFVERVWEWKGVYGGAILDQMKRLGASVDWSREYFTMDDRLSVAVKEAFVRLHEQGLIYRGAYIVNWDPVLRTAVSDLEVTHEERLGKIYHVRYPLVDGTGSIVIATTRPETMLGDTAVAVNPADERYFALHGKMLRLPLSGVDGGADREIPIVTDDWAKPEFGTGAVKVTPAHDPNDFAIGQRHNLPSITMLDEAAQVLLPGSAYHGLDRYVAREKIVEDLRELGLLVEVKDHTLAIGLSQRTGVVIEPRLSKQWFVKIQPLADVAIRAVDEGHIKFTPDQYRKTYDEWMKNIHDWCISRQLWWGHRIPAWHCGACSAITVARETPDVCSTCGSAEIVQETDVLDTWFSSGLLPFTVFGWPSADGMATPDLAAFYPTQVLVTGFDILFFWVARMIMLGSHFMLDVPMPDGSKRELKDAVPFTEVYIHALVRDADRQKMSKTKGNVIDPIDIISKFGTDAVRFTLASMASPGTDIAFSEERTDGYRAFANKIWNAARFLFMNVERAFQTCGVGVFDVEKLHERNQTLTLPADSPLEARWITTRMSQTAEAVELSLAEYRFDEAANAIYQFFWGDLCDWYLEVVKLRLNFSENEGDEEANREAMVALLTFVTVFDASLRMLSPFMPFITEEIWQTLHKGIFPFDQIPSPKSIALDRFPRATDFARSAGSVEEMTTLQELITTIRGLRKEMAVPEKESTPVLIHGRRVFDLATSNSDILARMSRVASVEFAPESLTGGNARSTAEFDVAVVYERIIDIPAERERLSKDLAKYEKGLGAAEKQLSNDVFMSKAPAHIVDGLRKQEAETRMLRDKTKAALDVLPPE
jgi:valyl-tRNA synthetase